MANRLRPRKRFVLRLRVGLKALLTSIAILSSWLAFVARQAEQQRSAANWIIACGGKFDFDHSDVAVNQRAVHYVATIINVSLNHTEVDDVAPLGRLSRLRSVDLAGTHVADLGPLSDLTSLEILDLSGTKLSDVACLHKLRRLETLALRNTKVSDISPLQNLLQLKTLDIVGTNVTNFEPLAHLDNLECLFVTRTADIEKFGTLKPDCRIIRRPPTRLQLPGED